VLAEEFDEADDGMRVGEALGELEHSAGDTPLVDRIYLLECGVEAVTTVEVED
jgi:hypothetical protein